VLDKSDFLLSDFLSTLLAMCLELKQLLTLQIAWELNFILAAQIQNKIRY